FIPPSEQAHIFEKFRRGGSSKDKAGSGLGLYIVKSLINSVNAELKISSNEKEGTTFSVYFPLASAP
ncbi:MAG: ATP-binding protein, partial [SAR324 cluster bacterium]|nr:ATP-binding protein [SAR324 cluster bacterium]